MADKNGKPQKHDWWPGVGQEDNQNVKPHVPREETVRADTTNGSRSLRAPMSATLPERGLGADIQYNNSLQAHRKYLAQHGIGRVAGWVNGDEPKLVLYEAPTTPRAGK